MRFIFLLAGLVLSTYGFGQIKYFISSDNGNPVALHKAIPKSKLKIVKGDHNNTYKSVEFSKAIIDFL